MIELTIKQSCILTLEGEDIELFFSIFDTLAAGKTEAGYVKTAPITEEQWVIIEGIRDSVKE